MKEETAGRLVLYLEAALGQAIGSMTGNNVSVALSDARAEDLAPLESAIIRQQSFSILEGPSFWIAAGKDLWEAMGRLTMQAAGVDEVTDEDCRSTWQEILGQTAGAVASAMTADLATEVTASQGIQIEAEPDGVAWLVFSVTGNAKTWSFKAGWTKELATLCEPAAIRAPVSPAARDSAVSKTFDLLLEVALPIAVSFGRTSLQIREVLKLNTGSIVELDRFVSDPVEVIVNDCVIARGEVVVVDGNYGVRINQLASREDRLRSGMAESVRKAAKS
jgi:flagellar motor switch protein FliN/FliY